MLKLEKEETYMLTGILLFILAGIMEIGGGYLVWQWIRESRPVYYGLFGAAGLVMYGVIAAFQVFPAFGRVYAAYGGIFIIMSLLWGWWIDGWRPDTYDWVGAAFCIIGVSIMLWAPRGA